MDSSPVTSNQNANYKNDFVNIVKGQFFINSHDSPYYVHAVGDTGIIPISADKCMRFHQHIPQNTTMLTKTAVNKASSK